VGGEEVAVGSVDEVHRRVGFGELGEADGDRGHGRVDDELVGDLAEPSPNVVDPGV
jgi:hypothetical protein